MGRGVRSPRQWLSDRHVRKECGQPRPAWPESRRAMSPAAEKEEGPLAGNPSSLPVVPVALMRDKRRVVRGGGVATHKRTKSKLQEGVRAAAEV